MLTAEHIRVRYDSRTVVEDVSFSLEAGQWLMLAGPNGAGKSTLVKALAQTIPYEGEFRLDGRSLRSLKPAERAKEMAVLSQHHSVQYAFTVEEIVRLGRYAYHQGLLSGRDQEGEAAVEEALEATGMTAFRRTSMLALSGGEMQRAFLAQVLAQRPRLLVLDEPASYLDLKYQQQLFELIGGWVRQPGRAVISVVHDLSAARKYGTDALLLSEGKCLSRGPAAEALSPAFLREAYGMDVEAWMKELLGIWAKN